jgi:uncharacterized membrane protein
MKKFLTLFLAITFFLPLTTHAQAADQFRARVIEVIAEQTVTRPDGSQNVQQTLRLEALEGERVGEEIIFDAINELDVINAQTYDEGDRVMMVATPVPDGGVNYYVTDYVRDHTVYWILGFFALVIITLGRWKGVRALVSLGLSFVVIVWFILPQLLAGHSPLFIGIIGAFFIIATLIYLTEGWRRQSHLAVVTILLSLIVVSLLSMLFTAVAHLSGYASEEVLILTGLGLGTIDFTGLLLAGIIIGTLGAMDDVVISQIESVAQLKEANPQMNKAELFRRATRIGTTHMGAMINTLFLAYAGASLPLLLLFNVNSAQFGSAGDIVNNEMVATEIVRTVVGSIGIALAIPIATWLAVRYIRAEDAGEHGHAH